MKTLKKYLTILLINFNLGCVFCQTQSLSHICYIKIPIKGINADNVNFRSFSDKQYMSISKNGILHIYEIDVFSKQLITIYLDSFFKYELRDFFIKKTSSFHNKQKYDIYMLTAENLLHFDEGQLKKMELDVDFKKEDYNKISLSKNHLFLYRSNFNNSKFKGKQSIGFSINLETQKFKAIMSIEPTKHELLNIYENQNNILCHNNDIYYADLANDRILKNGLTINNYVKNGDVEDKLDFFSKAYSMNPTSSILDSLDYYESRVKRCINLFKDDKTLYQVLRGPMDTAGMAVISLNIYRGDMLVRIIDTIGFFNLSKVPDDFLNKEISNNLIPNFNLAYRKINISNSQILNLIQMPSRLELNGGSLRDFYKKIYDSYLNDDLEYYIEVSALVGEYIVH